MTREDLLFDLRAVDADGRNDDPARSAAVATTMGVFRLRNQEHFGGRDIVGDELHKVLKVIWNGR